ncbi:MAG TPA: hypothetical protein VJA16_02765 [Thermoanaerobaculia bacterium]
MRTPRKSLLIPALVLAAAAGTAIAAGTAPAAASAAASAHPDQFTGSLVNTVAGARFSQPFILSVDHYTGDAEVQHLTGLLAEKGPYSLRDELWKHSVGYLRIGGRLGVPVAAVLSQDTATGRKLTVVLNRPLSAFEVQYYARSSMYPFSVLELDLDQNGVGQGTLIGAARMRMRGNTLEIQSLGVQPLRLLAVRAS